MIRTEALGQVRCQWGAAPIWWEGVLYFVDGQRVHRYDPASGSERSWELGQRVGAVVPRQSGGLVITGDRGFQHLDEESGVLTLLADVGFEHADQRFNNGKCSPDGRFFAGTISLTKASGTANLYRLDCDRSVHEVCVPETSSKGIAWSLDGETVYVIDAPRKAVLAFGYDEGHLRDPRGVVCTGHIDASPDGMTLDADGHLWIAFCHGGCVSCFDPLNGNELHRIALPCLETTGCAFGGPDLADLFVTTGVHQSAKEKQAGRLFVIRGLKTRGVAAHAFEG